MFRIKAGFGLIFVNIGVKCEQLFAISRKNNNLNAQIVIGVCDLFYYASNIIEDRAEDMYSKEHQVNYHGIDKRQRKEINAKKRGVTMRGM